jgi:hypothetical protein
VEAVAEGHGDQDLIQPLLGLIRPVLLMAELGLKLSYPIFGPSKLSG